MLPSINDRLEKRKPAEAGERACFSRLKYIVPKED
jgi:hypothetical protein